MAIDALHLRVTDQLQSWTESPEDQELLRRFGKRSLKTRRGFRLFLFVFSFFLCVFWCFFGVFWCFFVFFWCFLCFCVFCVFCVFCAFFGVFPDFLDVITEISEFGSDAAKSFLARLRAKVSKFTQENENKTKTHATKKKKHKTHPKKQSADQASQSPTVMMATMGWSLPWIRVELSSEGTSLGAWGCCSAPKRNRKQTPNKTPSKRQEFIR